ncbi:MAG: FHA domain-containing protein [Armatimonadetes bacterium]|nr:FHA domain-containing protein [Armatimonadota bacterium]
MTNGFGMDPVPGMGDTSSDEGHAGLTPANACLRIVNGPGAGRTFPLSSVRTLVGRNDPPAVTVGIDLTECELGEQFAVSRRHAEIQWVNGVLQIADVGSKNGTLVNNAEVRAADQGQAPSPVILKPGDKVCFGDIEAEVTTLG